MQRQCPRDGSELVADAASRTSTCLTCRGELAGLAVLRTLVDADAIKRLWLAARGEHFGPGLSCPDGEHRMRQVELDAQAYGMLGTEPVTLDVCTTCQHVWLDAGEANHLPLSTDATPPAASRPSSAELAVSAQAAGQPPSRRSWLGEVLEAVVDIALWS